MNVRRFVVVAAASVAGLAGLAFGGDYLSLRFAIPKRDAFDSVDIRHFFAVKLKNKQTSYLFDQPQATECVNSLFPHYGDNPCWYARRHTTVEVKIDDGPAGAWIDTP